MSRKRVLCLLACAAATSMAIAQTAPAPLDVMRRKSIFARDRVSRVPTTNYVRPSPSAISLPVLVGIVREDDGFVAVFESPGGALTPARVGQRVPGNEGIVTQISLDYLEFAASTTQPSQKVMIGRNISGAEAPAATTQPTTGLAPIEGDDLISRMRRRRQQESGR